MTRVKLYSTETGHVETIKTFAYGDPVIDREEARRYMARLVKQDRSTDHVYYVS